MSLLSDAEIVQAVGGSDPPDAETLAAARGAEAWLQGEARRLFILQDVAGFEFRVWGPTARLWLPDAPVFEFASLQRVLSRDEATGAVDGQEEVKASDYRVDDAAGFLELRGGKPWPRGEYLLGSPAKVGYTQAQLDDPSTIADQRERSAARAMKTLLKSVLRREVKGRSALEKHSVKGESATFNFDLTPYEEALLARLKR